jgi:hypothetical protein
MKLWKSISLVILIFALCGVGAWIVACGAEEDESEFGTLEDSEQSWFDENATALENCYAFYEKYFNCFDIDPTQAQLDGECFWFENFEAYYEDNQCIKDALQNYYDCLLDIFCSDYDDLAEMGGAAKECYDAFSAAWDDCPKYTGDDDDDATDDDDDDDDDDTVDDDDDDDDDDNDDDTV